MTWKSLKEAWGRVLALHLCGAVVLSKTKPFFACLHYKLIQQHLSLMSLYSPCHSTSTLAHQLPSNFSVSSCDLRMTLIEIRNIR